MPAKTRAKTARRTETATPQWFVFAIIASITFMLCMAINLRAYTEMSSEIEQNERLSVELERLTNENLAIQEEINNLKTDPRTIEREARKIGLGRPNEKILVPIN
ncbi:MAG: septum formation initiator family protein [Acidobacteria bacterium]|jgi:cell division protein FtsB|nr:septum formation initiator family protein [Acidobacteriota bacterium]